MSMSRRRPTEHVQPRSQVHSYSDDEEDDLQPRTDNLTETELQQLPVKMPRFGMGDYLSQQGCFRNLPTITNSNAKYMVAHLRQILETKTKESLMESEWIDVIGRHLQEDPLNEYFDHKDGTLRNCVYKLITRFDKTHVSPQGVLDKIDSYIRGPNEPLAETRMAIQSLINKNKPHVNPRDFEADKKRLSRLKLFQSIGPQTTKILQRKMRKYHDRNQPLSTEDLWRIAENNDIAEQDYTPPKKPTKITERLNHVQDDHSQDHNSTGDDQESYPRKKDDQNEELHFTDIRSRRSQQYQRRERYPSERRGRRDNSTPSTQVKKRNYNDLLVMLHPLLDRAGNDIRSDAERETEAKEKDSEQDKQQNPAEYEWPDEDMPLNEAADFWKDVVDGMAQFEIDVERQYRIDQAKADAERDARLKKAASQKQQFMTRFRNTDKYKELIAQRKDAAHAYKSEVQRHFRQARRTLPTNPPPTFKQFAYETHHPSLNIPHTVEAPQQFRNRYGHANQESSQAKRYCKRCGWRELPRACTHIYPPLIRTTGSDGRQIWVSKEGYTVETGHITDQCPTYKTDAMYRCSTCALGGITAFHSKFECTKVQNPNRLQEEVKIILVDEDGFELHDMENSGNE